jgi:hypothetical protein
MKSPIFCTHPQILLGRQIKENVVGRASGTHGGGENVYKVLVEKPEGKIRLVRPRRIWEVGIRMDFRQIGFGSVEWIHLAQHRDRWLALANTAMNLRVLAPRS